MNMAVTGRTTMDAAEELTSPKSVFVCVWYATLREEDDKA